MFIGASHPVANPPGSHHFPPVAQYLLVQNINTRYLRSFTIDDKTKKTILRALNDLLFQLMQEQRPLRRLVGDYERGWANADVINFLDRFGVPVDFSVGDHVRHIPILDVTIKTLRRGCNGDNDLLADVNCFGRLVNLYNHSVVRTTKLTPIEMERYPELEEAWIRHCKRINQEIELAYTLNYERGNILLVHFDRGKTHAQKFMKKSTGRQYSYLCEFLKYRGKNLVVRRLDESAEQRLAPSGRPDGRSRPPTYIIPYYNAIWYARSEAEMLPLR
jgi:hypothetical protein